jgi:hypothetical protein
MPTKFEAILSLMPNAKVTQVDDVITWHDPAQTPLSETEIAQELSRLQAEYEAKSYQRQRETAYPSFADQFDLLYHGGYDAWKAAIDAVKQEFPKP